MGGDVREAPHDLMTAISHANTILDWFENLPSDEQPPTWMWPFPDELKEWFDEVKIAREQKYGRSDDGDGWAESGSIIENEWSYDD